jgi:hypothetical protein
MPSLICKDADNDGVDEDGSNAYGGNGETHNLHRRAGETIIS